MGQDYYSSFPYSESSQTLPTPGAPGGSGASDHKVLVDSSDAVPGYLGAKLASGPNIVLTVQNAGANEDVLIRALNNQVQIDGNDTTPNYLFPKLQAGSGVSFTILNSGSNEVLRIDASSTPYVAPFGQQLFDYANESVEGTINQNGTSGAGSNNSGTRGFAFIPNIGVTLSAMSIAVRNVGGSQMRLGLYNASKQLIASTPIFAPVSNSFISVPLSAPIAVTGGLLYYMAYWTNDTTANLTFPLLSGRSTSNGDPVGQVSDPNQFPASIGNALTFTQYRNWMRTSE